MTIEPDAASWRCRPWPRVATAAPGMAAVADVVRFREQLGLPTDRPVVMSGHQAALWHAGIATKVFALAATARRFDAASAWVVVDQDVGVPGRVSYPVLRADKPGGAPRLARATLDLLAPASPDAITGRQPAAAPRPLEIDKATAPEIAASLGRMSAALARHAGEPSRAMQVSHAAIDLLNPRATPKPLISALAIAGTDLFRAVVDRVRRDPGVCVEHYNAAVARHPKARMRQLASSARRGPELPLWSITPVGTREPVYAADLDSTRPPGDATPTLAPRALAMTALLRWAGCDLFIHGLGGGHYDPVMEEWLAAWLGVRDLAPAVVVSATRLLPLVDAPPPTPEEVARAVWTVHHARHDPGLAVNPAHDGASPTLSADKRARIAAVATAAGPERLASYRAMHDWIENERAARAADLTALNARAADLSAQARTSGIVFDRTWPAALLPEKSVASLRVEVERRICG